MKSVPDLPRCLKCNRRHTGGVCPVWPSRLNRCKSTRMPAAKTPLKKTAWDHIETDDLLDPPIDVTGAIYPKRKKGTKHAGPYELEKLHTRVLMGYLRGAWACWGEYNPTGLSSSPTIPIAAIRAELAKRPHVPSKREGQKLRRLKQTRGH